MVHKAHRGDAPEQVLAVLSEGALDGYAIARRMERSGEGDEGDLYPLLQALERGGQIAGEWHDEGEGHRRKVYHLSGAEAEGARPGSSHVSVGLRRPGLIARALAWLHRGVAGPVWKRRAAAILLAAALFGGVAHARRWRSSLFTRGPAVVDLLRPGSPTTAAAVVSPDGSTLAGGAWQGDARLWNLRLGSATVLAGARNASLAFSPDGKLLASLCIDRTAGSVRNRAGGRKDSRVAIIRVWETQTGRQVGAVTPAQDQNVLMLAFSADGSLLASTGRWLVDRPTDGYLAVWDWRAGRVRAEFRWKGGQAARPAPAFSPDGALVACHLLGPERLPGERSYSEVRVYDVRRSRLTARLRAAQGSLWQFAFSPDGRALATGILDARRASVRLWDPRTGRLQADLPASGRAPLWPTFSPDGRMLAAYSWPERVVDLWDVGSGRRIAAFRGHEQFIQAIGFSRDGKLLAACCQAPFPAPIRTPGRTLLWDTATGRRVEPDGNIRWEDFPAEIAHPVYASGNEIRLYAPEDGRLLTTLTAPAGAT